MNTGLAFFRAYPAPREFLQQLVAKIGFKRKLPQPVAKIASTALLERIRAEALLR